MGRERQNLRSCWHGEDCPQEIAISSPLICPKRNQEPGRGKDLAKATQPFRARMLNETGRDRIVGLVSGAGVAPLRTPDWRATGGTFIV